MPEKTRRPAAAREAYSWRWLARSHAALPLAAALVAMPALVWQLPRDGFCVGDAGVKLIAAEQAAAHPMRPLEIDPPVIGDASALAFMEPFFQVHGDHAHASTAEVFPLLIAPFVALWGTTGAYIVPILSFLALIPVMVAWAERLALPGSPATAGWAVALLSPLVFYALECWEHVPAVLCVATAAWLTTNDSSARPRPIAGGLAMALAILLRPEAAWSAIAVVVMLARGADGWRRVAAFAAAICAGLLPLGLYNTLHFGAPWGPHLTANAGLLPGASLASRLDIVRLWLLTWRTTGSLWATFPVALLAFAAPGWTPRTRSLWLLVGIPLVGVILTAPNDGGAQWGPRYLLIIVPPLLLLALDSGARLLARHGTARWLGAAVTVIAVVVGLATTRTAYRDLRGSKRLHASLAHDVASLQEPYVVTDLWWLDQLAASAEPRPTFLYVRNPSELETVIAMFGRAGVDHFATVRGFESRDSTWATPWPGRCVALREQRIAVRDLRATLYECPK